LTFTIVSACGLHFRPFKPQLDLWPRSEPATSIFGLRPQFLTLQASTRPAASISACGLNFWSFGLQLDPGYSAAFGRSRMRCSADDASP